jgi:murein DD-endopeptidase MepM/ murein hydrolase activator NlpD
VQLPVPGVISSGFGPREHPVLGHADDHRGVDIAAPVGTPVRVPYAGRVHEVGENPALGRYVIVEHEGGYRSVFGHLSESTLEAGAPVRVGDVVARSGNTGRSTGPHLHYGLYRNGRAVDPTPHLR